MANLYDKAGLVNIPVGYQEGFLYNIKPTDNTLAFRFNRDSAATRVNKEGLIEQVGYFGPEIVKNGNFSELGPELIVNGDFATDSDWTKGSAWTIANGQASYDASSVNAITSSTTSMVSGKTYRLKFKITTSGFARLNFTNDSSQVLFEPNGNSVNNFNSGEYTFYLSAQNNSTALRIFAYNNSVGTSFSIDNVSVKQVDPNDYWTLGTGWSIEDNKAVAVNASNQSLSQSTSSVLLNKKYRISFDVEYISGSAKFQLVGGTTQDVATITSSGTQVIEVVSDANKASYRIKGLTTGGGFNGSIDNISIVEVLGDKPRIDYTDSLTSPSFLLEPQSTNTATYSNDFTQGDIFNGSVDPILSFSVLTQNQGTAPDGTNTAQKLTDNNDGGTGSIELNYFSTTLSSGEASTVSVFVKKDTVRYFRISIENYDTDVIASFDLDTGLVNSGTGVMTNYGDGWYRCSVTITTTTDLVGAVSFAISDNPTASGGNLRNGTKSTFLWGLQAEEQSYATSYIPTAGSTATRAQETCNGAGSASTFNSTEGVLYADIAALANDGTNRRITISDGTTTNRLIFQYRSASNEIAYYFVVGGVNQCAMIYTLSNATQFSKIALKYKTNDFALWVDGTKVMIDTFGNTMSVGTLSSFDFDGNTGLPFYGKTKGVYVFNEALTDDELQQLTGPEYNSFAALAAAYNYTVI